MDALDARGNFRAPFPYFGGKVLAAAQIWDAFGSGLGNYVEPFFGSGAVWLNRPESFDGWSSVNDLNGHVANFWRAIRRDPLAVAAAADWPVNEIDIHARHLRLVNAASDVPRMMADPDYCDPVLAGWWCWGICSWIGGGWCSGEGPWRAVPDADGIPILATGDSGLGINRQLPHLTSGLGINRKLPHLTGGLGINRKLPHLTGGACAARTDYILGWMQAIADRMRDTRVTCGGWERVCSPGTMTRNGPCAVLLDPPYSQTAAVYASDSQTVSGDVRAWCLANGSNPALRIVLCGHQGEHHELEDHGWSCVPWEEKKSGGYALESDTRERLWLSPACVAASNPAATQLALF